jgi:hypothetical protein
VCYIFVLATNVRRFYRVPEAYQMRDGFNAWIAAMVVQAVVFSLAAVLAAGQTPAAAAQSGEVRRTSEGTPDLSGIWQVMNTAAWDIQDHSAQKGVPAGQGVVEGNEIPYLPAAAAKKKANYENRATADPETKCYLPGVPRITYMPYPFQIAQSPKQVTILYEYVHAVRNIFMGSPHIKGPIDWWMGDSRGRWEGNTLVVDVIHFNEETWFDRAGNHHSDALHVVERYTPVGPDHINYEATIEDPKTFSRPWKMSMLLYRHKEKNAQILEYECFSF